MLNRLIGAFTTLLLASCLTGCGSPFLHSPASRGVSDPGLVGEWAAKEPLRLHAEIFAPPTLSTDEAYRASLTAHDQGQFKTALTLSVILTDAGDARFMDLFLARSERDKLVATYGLLVVPVHQVMKVSRDGDTLTVWPISEEWLKAHAGDTLAREPVSVGGGESSLSTASGDRVREVLARIGTNPDAFAEPIVFHRVSPSPERR